MKEKRCFKCEEIKSLADYYAHPKMKDGHLGKCKVCTKNSSSTNYHKKILNPYWKIKEQVRNRKRRTIWRQDHKASYDPVSAKKWRLLNPKKEYAKSQISYALKTKKLTKEPCKECGTIKDVQGHHPDYDKPLEVIWLCREHHHKLHVKLREIIILENI